MFSFDNALLFIISLPGHGWSSMSPSSVISSLARSLEFLHGREIEFWADE
jgi:hypothetical protein